ncbi:MAG TPA: cell envelope biogenesis protein TolA, partial [Beijerinckiaceae bacterium]|nr:cell envelope biogenesis protein TolA [Beijerinckiaceae bacterium]
PPPGPRVEGEENIPGRKPKTFAAPRGGTADDLKRIRGIGKQNEGRLHALGIWHFDQIAAWVKDEIEWVGSYLAFPGRIEREEWVSQAKVLATGSETEFSRRVARGEVATSKDEGARGQDNVADLTGVKGKPKP